MIQGELERTKYFDMGKSSTAKRLQRLVVDRHKESSRPMYSYKGTQYSKHVHLRVLPQNDKNQLACYSEVPPVEAQNYTVPVQHLHAGQVSGLDQVPNACLAVVQTT